MKLTTTYPILQIVVPLLVALITVASAIPFAKSRRTTYEAAARVWIQAQIPNMPGDRDASSGLYLPYMTFFNSPITTSSELIRSGEVVREATDIVNAKHPDWHVDEGTVSVGLSAVPIKDTDILLVKYSDVNPKRASETLSAVLEGFLVVSSKQSSASATNERAFLETRLDGAQKNLKEISAKIEKFQRLHNVSNMEYDMKELVDRLSQMRDKVREEEIELRKKTEEIAHLQAELQSTPEGSGAIVAELERKLGQQELRVLELSQAMNPKHPYLVKLNKSIQITREALHKAQSEAGSHDRRDLGRALMLAKQDLLKIQAQLQSHRAHLLTQEKRCADLPSQSVEWAELTREKQLAANTVSEAEKSLKAASLLETVSQRATNIKVIDKPSVPTLPNGPSKKLTMAIAAVVGLLLAVGVFVVMVQLNPIATKASQTVAILGFPVVGIFNKKGNSVVQANAIRRGIQRKIVDTKRIVITSALPGDGKTDLAKALAESFANNGSKVLLVDTNPNNDLSKQYKLDPTTPGLGEFSQFPEAVDPVQEVMDNLLLLSVGVMTKALSLFEHPEVVALIEKLEESVDFVIFDCSGEGSLQAVLSSKVQSLTAVLVSLRKTLKNEIAVVANQLAQAEVAQGLVVLSNAQESDLVVARTAPVAATPTAATLVPEEQSVW